VKVNRRNFLQVSLAGLAAISLPISLIDGGVIHLKYKVMSQGGTLQTYDIWPGMKLFMSPEVIAQVEAKKAFNLVYEYNQPHKGYKNKDGTQAYTRRINLVRYVGITADTIEEGVERLADIVEQAAKKWKVQATLAPGIALQLAQIDHLKPGKWACCSYLVFDFTHPNTENMRYDDKRLMEHYDKMEKEFYNWEYSFREGGTPKYFGKTRDYEGKVREFQRNELTNNVSKIKKGKHKVGKTWTKQELKV